MAQTRPERRLLGAVDLAHAAARDERVDLEAVVDDATDQRVGSPRALRHGCRCAIGHSRWLRSGDATRRCIEAQAPAHLSVPAGFQRVNAAKRPGAVERRHTDTRQACSPGYHWGKGARASPVERLADPASRRCRVRRREQSRYLALRHEPRNACCRSRPFVALLAPRPHARPSDAARAGGNFIDQDHRRSTESNGEWHVKVRIDLARAAADDAHPRCASRSRRRRSTSAPSCRRGPTRCTTAWCSTCRPSRSSRLDVDFADPSGKVFKSTYFEFDLQRASGYFEAGEYQVTLAGPDGDVGGAQKLVAQRATTRPSTAARWTSSGSDKRKKKGRRSRRQQRPRRRRRPGSGGNGDDSSSAAPTATDVAPVGNGGGMVPTARSTRPPEEEAVQGPPEGLRLRRGRGSTGPSRSRAAVRRWLGVGLVARRSPRRARRSARDARPRPSRRPGKGELLPVYVVAGEERLLRDEVVARAPRRVARRRASRRSTRTSSRRARSTSTTILAAARTVPMMAPRRFVLVRGAERWDAGEGRGADVALRPARRVRRPRRSIRRAWSSWRRSSTGGASSPLAGEASRASIVACDPLDAPRAAGVDRRPLRGRRGTRSTATSPSCSPRSRGRSCRRWTTRSSGCRSTSGRARRSTRPRSGRASRACGPPTRGRWSTPWARATSARALRTLADAYDPRERGLPLLGALAWSIRQLARYQAARRRRAPRGRGGAAWRASSSPSARGSSPRRRAGVPVAGGRALDARARGDRSGAQELSPRRRRHPRGDAHAALPRRSAGRARASSHRNGSRRFDGGPGRP